MMMTMMGVEMSSMIVTSLAQLDPLPDMRGSDGTGELSLAGVSRLL